jgi:hypothetical protein
MRALGFLLSAGLTVAALGCAGEGARRGEHEARAARTKQLFTSVEATQLDFELDGVVVTDNPAGAEQAAIDQLFYTVGSLNAHRSVGRFERLELSSLATTDNGDGTWTVTYHAKMPVAWGETAAIPASFTFQLPSSVVWSSLTAFTNAYSTTCVDPSAHGVDPGSMWYFYRPDAPGCALAPADVMTTTATVSPSVEVTTGKYPEYHEVWSDDVLEVVAIFGKDDPTSTSNYDAGIYEYNKFVRLLKQDLQPYGATTIPAGVSGTPGAATPDVTIHANLGGGKSVKVTALLVNRLADEGAPFDTRFDALTPTADMVMYNGHAGLGWNARSLLHRGRYVAGKYLMLFINGCDTFAYTDRTLVDRRALLNPDDPTGTKYMDVVVNAMPGYFSSLATDSLALVRGMLSTSAPKTYEQMLASFDAAQVAVVTGEEDNVFAPGMPIGTQAPAPFAFDASGSVMQDEEQDWSTAVVPAGTYTVTLAEDPASPGGDADLYVKVGAPPTLGSFDCRPYRFGSNETCTVTLAAPAAIYVKVVGWDPGPSAYLLHISN